MSTAAENEALDVTLSIVENVKIAQDVTVAFNGNNYVVFDDYGDITRRFDELNGLVRFLQDNCNF